jgi:hypothetical protein
MLFFIARGPTTDLAIQIIETIHEPISSLT